MNPFIQILVVLFVILCFVGIGYAMIYNYQAAQNNAGLVTELGKQHQKDMDNVQQIVGDVNVNDKILADKYDQLKTRIDANQIELLQFIDLKQDSLLQTMNMDLVVQRLDQAEADMLAQLVQREVAILKVMVQTQSTLMTNIKDVNHETLNYVDKQFAAATAQIAKNFNDLANQLSSYELSNQKNIENLTHTITQLNLVYDLMQQQQQSIQKGMNTTNLNFELLQADLQSKYIYLLDMIVNDENSQENKLALLLTQSIWVDTATNNVGIGTTNPKDALELKHSGGSFLRVSGGTAGVNMCVGNNAQTGASTNCGQLMSDNAGNLYVSPYADNQTVYLQASAQNTGGNVVIGTNTVPSSIPAYRKPTLYVNGHIAGAQGIELGTASSYKKDAGAGLIQYQGISGDSLDISGAGSIASKRQIKFWADNGSFFLNSNLGPAPVTTGPLSATTASTSGMLSANGGVAVTGGLTVGSGNVAFNNGGIGIGSTSITNSGNGNNMTFSAASLNINSQTPVSITGGLNIASGNINVSSGTITASGDITAFSDARMKSDVQKIDKALDKIKQMNGYTFNKNGDTKRSTGVIAQEVQAVLPEAVKEEENGYMSVAYGNMAGIMIEAIKQLDDKIEALKK